MYTLIGRGPLAKELFKYFENGDSRIIHDFKIKNLFEEKAHKHETVVLFCADTENFCRSVYLNLLFCMYAITRKNAKFIYFTTVNSLKFMGDDNNYTPYIGADYYSLRRSFLNKLVSKLCFRCEMKLFYLPVVLGDNQNWSKKISHLSNSKIIIRLPTGIKRNIRTVTLQTIYRACCSRNWDEKNIVVFDRKIRIENLFLDFGCENIQYYPGQRRPVIVSIIILIIKMLGLRRVKQSRDMSNSTFSLDQRLEQFLIGK